MAADTHLCPASRCAEQVPYGQLMCRGHWFMVPGPLRAAVFRAWDDGRGAGTAAHRAAMLAAIGAVNSRIGAS